jgi:ribosomal protein S1
LRRAGHPKRCSLGLGFRLALAADTHRAPLPPLTPATQTSVAAYGVFINIGAALDGLAHISELSVRLAWRRLRLTRPALLLPRCSIAHAATAPQYEFVADVSAMLTVGQEVEAWVLNIDTEKRRFGLTLKAPGSAPPPREPREPREPRGDAAGGDAEAGERRGKVARAPRGERPEKTERKPITVKKGDWVDGKVLSVLPYGAVVEVEEGVSGLLHVSEMSEKPDAKPEDIVKVDQVIKVRIDNIDKEKLRLSMMEKFDVRWPTLRVTRLRARADVALLLRSCKR